MHTNICIYCGKMFNDRKPSYVCKDCIPKDEEFFQKITDYLKKYPNSNAMQIAEGLEVSALEIIRYIDEGRLQMNKGEFKKI
ncbi:MAG: hypothetical protein K6B75_01200 [Lachnospiraceae bacterium]|nr:hypothetical protein [Lachnospiraceae bacterium]